MPSSSPVESAATWNRRTHERSQPSASHGPHGMTWPGRSRCRPDQQIRPEVIHSGQEGGSRWALRSPRPDQPPGRPPSRPSAQARGQVAASPSHAIRPYSRRTRKQRRPAQARRSRRAPPDRGHRGASAVSTLGAWHPLGTDPERTTTVDPDPLASPEGNYSAHREPGARRHGRALALATGGSPAEGNRPE